MKTLSRVLFVCVISFTLSQCLACGEKAVEPESNNLPRNLTESEENLVQSGNNFGFNLFKTVAENKPGENIFISPLSVSMALGMTYNGADGSTKEAMENVLGFSGLSLEEINESYQSLIYLLTQLDDKVEFSIANSIWYRLGLPVRDEFINVNQSYFNAVVAGMNFSSPDAAPRINNWVSENTKGKIPQIVTPPINPETVMFLINAIYFKGDWTQKFDPEDTRQQAFYLQDNTEITCSMMHQFREEFFEYYQNDLFQAIDLKYGDRLYSMTILLPRPGTTTDDLIARLDQQTWNDWIGNFSVEDVDLDLPKFKLSWESCLNDVLISLGMGVAFSPGGADFSRIADVSPNNLYISKVLHKTFIDVNEEGTEAAAATSVEIGITSVSPFYKMEINRPFIFVIREHHSQTILFMGRIVEPVIEE